MRSKLNAFAIVNERELYSFKNRNGQPITDQNSFHYYLIVTLYIKISIGLKVIFFKETQ